MYFIVWFCLGAVLAVPLIVLCKHRMLAPVTHIMGISLVIAALIYVGFAMVWGDMTWLSIELVGVACYGLFYWLAVRYSLLWLAIGWLSHPAWDLALHLYGPGSHVVPEWYAIVCFSFDLVIAGYLVVRHHAEQSGKPHFSGNR